MLVMGSLDKKGVMALAKSTPTVHFAGHSVQAAAVSNTATETRMMSYGMAHWVPALTKQAVETTQKKVIATPGITTPGYISSRLSELVLAKPDNVVMDIGTNDLTLAMYTDNITTIWDAVLAAGSRLIAIPVMPRNLVDQASRDRYQAMAAFCLEKGALGIKDFHAIDISGDYGDSASATWAPKANTNYDGLHPIGLGGFYTSRKVADLFKLFYPQRRNISMVASQYSAENVRGNIIPNGVLKGTGGAGSTNQGVTAVAGGIPTGWNAIATAPYSGGSALSGLTMLFEKLTDPDGTDVVRITYSGAYTGDVDTFLGMRWTATGPDLAKLSPDDYVEVRGEIKLLSGAVTPKFAGFQLGLGMTMGGTYYRAKDGYTPASGRMPAEGFDAIYRTPPIRVSAVPTTMDVQVYGIPTQGAQTLDNPVVIEIRRIQMTKVPAP